MISINAHFSGFFGTEEDSYIHPADRTLSVVAVEKKKNKKKLTSACPRLQPNMLNKHTGHWCHHHHSLQLVHGYTRTCWTNTLVTSAIITHFSLSMATPGHVGQTHWSPVPSSLTSACPWLHQDMLDKHTGHQCHHHSLQLVHGYTRTCWTNTLVTSAIITHFSLSMTCSTNISLETLESSVCCWLSCTLTPGVQFHRRLLNLLSLHEGEEVG